MSEVKANHRVNIVRLPAPRVHTNADSLEIFDIEGYQVVSKKGQFNEDDLAVYIQPDSVVPQTEPFKFIWENYVGLDGTVPEKCRRITVRKFRGEYSEGLLMPIADFNSLYAEVGQVYPGIVEGADVSERLGITHYDPDAGTQSTKADTANAPRRKYPTTLKGWFYFVLYRLGIKGAMKSLALDVNLPAPTYDVDAFKNFKRVIQPKELVQITEKIHGSNARYMFVDGDFYAGSRNQWKKVGDNVWWNAKTQEVVDWCRAHPGQTLYGEVTPTQKGFNYGSDEAQFFAFDAYDPKTGWFYPRDFEGQHVPIVHTGEWHEGLLALADGETMTIGRHMREGIVIRPIVERRVPGLGRVHLKVVSNRFLEKDSK